MPGWIKMWRKIVDWQWYKDGNTMRLFQHLLLTANFHQSKWMGEDISEGQVVTTLDNISKELGMSIQCIRTSLTKLKSTNEITSRSTNKYTVITIVNWASYQCDDETLTNKTTTDSTNEQQTTNKQLTNEQHNTKKNKKEKKEKNINSSESIRSVICSYTDDIGLQEALFGWNEMRTLKKKPLTPRAMQLALDKLDKLEGDKAYNVDYATMKCWESFYQPPENQQIALGLPRQEKSKYQTVQYESRSD